MGWVMYEIESFFIIWLVKSFGVVRVGFDKFIGSCFDVVWVVFCFGVGNIYC